MVNRRYSNILTFCWLTVFADPSLIGEQAKKCAESWSSEWENNRGEKKNYRRSKKNFFKPLPEQTLQELARCCG